MEKVITYKRRALDIKSLKPPTHSVNSFYIDENDMVCLSIQKGNQVDQLRITMERSEEIGLINFKAIEAYLK